nr:hypothetical protein JVH1_2680 [Rhodococcus sp. JVH1]
MGRLALLRSQGSDPATPQVEYRRTGPIKPVRSVRLPE